MLIGKELNALDFRFGFDLFEEMPTLVLVEKLPKIQGLMHESSIPDGFAGGQLTGGEAYNFILTSLGLITHANSHGYACLCFDTHKAVKALKDAGADERLATVGEAIGDNVATKTDITELKGELTLVKWMLGVNLAFSLALLLKTFFA